MSGGSLGPSLPAALARIPHPFQSSKIVGEWYCDAREHVFAGGAVADFFRLDPSLTERGLPPSAFFAMVHPDDREWLGSLTRKQVARGGIALAQYRVVRADEVRWLMARGQFYRDEDDTFLGGSGIFIDVTEARLSGDDTIHAAPGGAVEDPLLRLSAHALALRHAVDDLKNEPELRRDVDTLLRSVGFAIARMIGPNGSRLN